MIQFHLWNTVTDFVLGEELDGGVFVLADVVRVDELRFLSHPALHFGSFEEELLGLQRKVQFLASLHHGALQLLPSAAQHIQQFHDLQIQNSN